MNNPIGITRLLKDILSYKKFASIFGLIIAITALSSIFAGAGIGLFIPVIELLSKGGIGPEGGGFIGKIIGFFRSLGINPSLPFFISVIFLLIFLQALTEFLRRIITAKLRDDLTKYLRDRSFENLMEVSLEYYHNKKAGELTSVLGDEAYRGGIAVQFVSDIMAAIMISCIYIAVLLLISWQVVLFMLLLSLLSFFSIKKMLRRSENLGRKKGDYKSSITNFCFENFNSYFLINIFNYQKTVKERFFALTEEIRRNLSGLTFHSALIVFFNTITRVAAVCALIYILYDVLHLSIGYLATVLLVITQLAPKISEINILFQGFSENIPGLRNIYQLSLRADKPYIKNGTVKLNEFGSSIEFRDVSFEYVSGKPVLRRINLKVEKGRIVSIIGSSGSGKSTLISLIPRFYDTSSGEILIDGRDLKELDMHDWRNKLGFISQETFIYNDTIKKNLLVSRNDASDADICEALRLAHLDDFIDSLPAGIETVVGDRGMKLSGGQKQRIAIARVFLRDPQVLILDEATSSLDSISENLIQASINELSRSRTVIVVAHRLSTIKRSDKILVLEDGAIVEEGLPEELIKRNGHYYKYLSASQH